jgi:Na+-translocating ferredoxin:NAD+ oxidoreductase RnfG subunit
MSEYIFFDPTLRDRFLTLVADHRIQADTRPDPIEGFLVILPEALPDEIDEALEEEYERLMDEQQQLVEAGDEQDRTVMGVDITLPDGRACVVRLPPIFARRLCDHFSGDEIRMLVTEIAASVLDPATGPLCRER